MIWTLLYFYVNFWYEPSHTVVAEFHNQETCERVAKDWKERFPDYVVICIPDEEKK